MPGCFHVPGSGARCVSARAVIGASSTARQVAVTSLGANRCARRDAGISTLDAADTVMPSASAATAAGAATGGLPRDQRSVEEGATSWSYAEVPALLPAQRTPQPGRGPLAWRQRTSDVDDRCNRSVISRHRESDTMAKTWPRRARRSERAGARDERDPPHRAAVEIRQCRAGAWYRTRTTQLCTA